ncbi:hypothetical protein [Bradyrhizobium sp. ISRA442]|uniref:hypothetical protein n=1 Tax=unclassified Bradyrhizobium TaxID=2631580 RepID=UPI00311B366C
MNALCHPARRRAIAFAFAVSLTVPPALSASGPPPGFTLTDDAELAFTSPDGATKLEEYKKGTPDDDIKWQVWAASR